MSLLEKKLPAFIVIRYSDKRKLEMRQSGLKHCSIIASIIKQVLDAKNISKFKIVAPKNTDRYNDLYLLFDAASKELIRDIANEIFNRSPLNLAQVEGHIHNF